MKQSMKDLAEYLTLLSSDGWTDIENALALCDIARQLDVMNEDDCNIAFSEEQQARREKRELRLKMKAGNLLPSGNWQLVFGTDPRGPSIKVKTPNDLANDWGRVGVCVPTTV